jgi:hypothetical protein
MAPPAYIGAMQIYRFLCDPVFVPMLLTLGVHPGNALVSLTDDDRFVAQFGRWEVDTPLSNIDCVEVAGPYRWYRAIGVRGSRVDNGITFGSSTAGGVCVTFHEPIRRLLPGLGDHPGLTVTVVDTDGLAAVLESRR